MASNTHNSRASVQVTNNFPYATDITINHTYDNSPSESHTWMNVLPSTTTDPDLTVTFNLGLFHGGHDYWQVEVAIHDGPTPGRYISAQGACTLHNDDNGAVLTASVDASSFTMSASSNHCSPAWTTHP